jgi:hypothetical protein
MKLSHSAVNKYIECPYSYKLHYLDKIRSPLEPSALTFGGSIDKAFVQMLSPDTTKTPEDIFYEEWQKNHPVRNPNAKFTKSDYDEDLVNATGLDTFGADDDTLAWLSLQEKGLLMLKALREKLLPQIEEVLSVQEMITLKNQDDSGDEVIGYIDFVIRLKGYDSPIIGDLKTSSIVYTPESVKESQQLTIYTYAAGEKYGTRLAGFFVLSKKIKKNKKKVCKSCGLETTVTQTKKCPTCSTLLITEMNPEAELSIIIDEIPVAKEEEILCTIDQAHKDIKEEKFEQKFSGCTNKYFQKCVYYNLCHNNDAAGLLDYSKPLDSTEKK